MAGFVFEIKAGEKIQLVAVLLSLVCSRYSQILPRREVFHL